MIRQLRISLSPSCAAGHALLFFAFAYLNFCPARAFCEPESSPPSETELLEKQRVMEKDLETRVQGILQKVFGPEQSEVKASVSLSILTSVAKKSGSGELKKRKEENPLGDTKFILPGVPAPRNVAKEKEPDNVEKQSAAQEEVKQKISFKIDVTNRKVIVFYNEKLKNKEPSARKAVMAMTNLAETELEFIPGQFFSTIKNFKDDFMSDPKNLLYGIMCFLFFLLLFWLFVPLTSFFQNYIKAMKEKGGIEVKMESSGEEKGGKDGMTPEELAAQEALEMGKEGEDEMAKKYVPFEYISEENIKRLLGVFRKEPPQVIALVLSYLKPELVKYIYAELPSDLLTKVAAESGSLRQATEEQVRMVDDSIKAKIDFLVGGVDNLVRMLDEVDYKTRDNILEYLMNQRPQLYEKVRQNILMFEDILKFPDLAMQTIIRELKTDQLARALKTADPEIMNKFLSNMSQGGAALLKEEMEFGRPAPEDLVEQERQHILDAVKALEKKGTIHVRELKKISIFESEDATSPLLPSLPGEDRPASRFAGSQERSPEPIGGAAAEDAHAYLSYGEQLYNNEKYEEAIPYLQYALGQDSSLSSAHQLLGHCYYALGQVADSLVYYEYALALNPNDDNLKVWIDQIKQSVKV